MSTITMKFGGTSMGSHDAIAQVARIICDQAAQGDRILTVVSAMSGVTDMLLEVAATSSAGDEGTHFTLIDALRQRHHETPEQLFCDEKNQRPMFGKLDTLMACLNALCHRLTAPSAATTTATILT